MQETKPRTNPMQLPGVAEKQAASLRAAWADPKRRAEMMANRKGWTPEMRARQSELMKQKAAARPHHAAGVKWSDERKRKQAETMRDYWARVRTALALLDNRQHAD